MGEDGRVPPLSRRVPGATDRERRKPVPRVPPRRLPDSLLQRMQAAIDASPDRAAAQVQAACPELPAALPRRGPGASDDRKPQARPAPSAFLQARIPSPEAETPEAETPEAETPEPDTQPIQIISASASS